MCNVGRNREIPLGQEQRTDSGVESIGGEGNVAIDAHLNVPKETEHSKLSERYALLESDLIRVKSVSLLQVAS